MARIAGALAAAPVYAAESLSWVVLALSMLVVGPVILALLADRF